jgi:hypothetical protein
MARILNRVVDTWIIRKKPKSLSFCALIIEAYLLLSTVTEGMDTMKTSQFTKKIGTAILGLSLMSGLGFAMSTTAQAQDPWGRWQQGRDNRQDRRDDRRDNRRGRRRSNDDYPNWGGSFQLRQTALNAGYNEGIKEGRKDRQKNRRYNFRDVSSYQKATKDYDSKYGERELFRRYFREAFENGYDAGYNGY